MSTPDRSSPVRTLKEKWLSLADEQMCWSKVSDSKHDGANSHTERARARIYRECAADLDTLFTSLRQDEDETGVLINSWCLDNDCRTRTHCDHHGRCLAECEPSDLVNERNEKP